MTVGCHLVAPALNFNLMPSTGRLDQRVLETVSQRLRDRNGWS
ncbi:hypothetical protein ACWG8W_00790 [Citricoccus zhacaiensis]